MNPVPIWSAILTPPKPTSLRLDLQFAADQAYVSRRGPLPTFSRTTAATFVGSNGLIQSAAIDVPRIDFDPATLACRGLLIEEGRTNLALWSEDATQLLWFKSGTTATADQGVAPDGATTADLVVEDTANSQHFIRATNGNPVVNGTTYTSSIFLKKGTGTTAPDWMLIQLAWPGFAKYCAFNLTTGAFGLAATGFTYSAKQFPGGWWRVTVTAAATATGNNGYLLLFFTNNTNTAVGPTYIGATTSNMFAWGCQFEVADSASSYIPTTAGTGSRTVDLCSITGGAFSGFWNASEGTMAVNAELSWLNPTLAQAYASANDGTINNRMFLRHFPGFEQLGVVTGGVTQVGSTLSGVLANVRMGIAARYKLNDFAVAVSGGAVSTDVSGTVPTVNKLDIGNEVGGSQLNGWIQSIQYYNVIKTNAQLQALSLP